MEKKLVKECLDLNDYLEISGIITLVNGSQSIYCPHNEEIAEAYKTYEEEGITKTLVEKVFKVKRYEETFKYSYSDSIRNDEITGTITKTINGESKITSFCLFKIAEDLDGSYIYSVVIDNKFKCACKLISSSFFHKFDVVHLSGFKLVDGSVADEAKRTLRKPGGN